jgi:hypothetical protein
VTLNADRAQADPSTEGTRDISLQILEGEVGVGQPRHPRLQ